MATDPLVHQNGLPLSTATLTSDEVPSTQSSPDRSKDEEVEPLGVSSSSKGVHFTDELSKEEDYLSHERLRRVSETAETSGNGDQRGGLHFITSKEEVLGLDSSASRQKVGGDSDGDEGMEIKRKLLEMDRDELVVNSSPTGRFVRYEHEIGRGSFKTVYKGLDTETGVAVAWCELQEQKFNKDEQLRFKDEVSILKTLNHPYILRLYDSWEFTRATDKKRILVLITELMTSGTLKSYMRRLKSIKPRVIRSWGRQILKGLAFLHTRTPPIIHRDLKCDNIFINGTTGLVKIGDLGLATLKRSDVKTVIGTPEFMAPEMYDEIYDESVDVYAFGMCLLEMCTLEYPYQECRNPAQIYKKVTSGILPQSLAKVSDPMLRDIIEGCTKLGKSVRYTVEQLLDHEFFAEGDVKVEVMQEPTTDSIMFRLMVPSRENQKNGQESIEFSYNLETDVPENVVDEMIKSGMLREEDKKNAIRSVRELTDPVKQKRQQRVTNTGGGVANGTVSKDGEVSLQSQSSHVIDTPNTPLDLEAQRSKFQRQLSSASDDATLDSGKAPEQQDKRTGLTTPSDGMSTNNSPNTQHKQIELSEDSESEEGTQPVDKPAKPVDSVTSVLPPSAKEITPIVEDIKHEEQQEVVLTRTLSDEVQESISANSMISIESKDINKTPSLQSLPSTSQLSVATETVVPGVSAIQPTLVTQSSLLGNSQSQSSMTQLPVVTQSQSVSVTGSQSVSVTGSQPLVTQSQLTTGIASTQSDPAPSSSTEHQSTTNGTGRTKKATRGKEVKKMRLKYTDKNKDVISCSLHTSSGQVINFKFSSAYDKPKEIFQNLLKAGHLSQSEEGDFIAQTHRVMESARKPVADDSKQRTTSTGGTGSKPESADTKGVDFGTNKMTKVNSEGLQEPVSLATGAAPGVKNEPVLLEQAQKRFDVSASTTSQSSDTGSAVSVTPIHMDDLPTTTTNTTTTTHPLSINPDSTKINSLVDTEVGGVMVHPLPTCSITTESTCLNLTPPLSTTAPTTPDLFSVVSSATSSHSSLPPVATKRFEIEDVTDESFNNDAHESLSTESSTENLLPLPPPHSDEKTEQPKSGVETPESHQSVKDDDSVGGASQKGLESMSVNSMHSEMLLHDEEQQTSLTCSQVDGLLAQTAPSTSTSVSKPHPSFVTQSQPVFTSHSAPSLPPVQTFPVPGLNHPLLMEGFIKFLHYMKLLFQDPTVAMLLQQMDTQATGVPATPVPPVSSGHVLGNLYMPAAPSSVPVSSVSLKPGQDQVMPHSDDETDGSDTELKKRITEIEVEEFRLKQEKQRVYDWYTTRRSQLVATPTNLDSTGHILKQPPVPPAQSGGGGYMPHLPSTSSALMTSGNPAHMTSFYPGGSKALPPTYGANPNYHFYSNIHAPPPPEPREATISRVPSSNPITSNRDPARLETRSSSYFTPGGHLPPHHGMAPHMLPAHDIPSAMVQPHMWEWAQYMSLATAPPPSVPHPSHFSSSSQSMLHHPHLLPGYQQQQQTQQQVPQLDGGGGGIVSPTRIEGAGEHDAKR